MNPSSDALNLAKASEGLRLESYRCPAGVPTIGYGHTRGVRMGQAITQAQADQYLVDDMDDAARAVNDIVTVPLRQCEFDSLCDFVFNFGEGRFRDSKLLRLLNSGYKTAASIQFRIWVMGGGQVLPGLVKRRAAELDLFRRKD